MKSSFRFQVSDIGYIALSAGEKPGFWTQHGCEHGVKASIIIPAYNACQTLGACLKALQHQTVSRSERSEYEILVVDDGSTDRTAQVAREHGGVRLLSQPHRGPAAARNLGAHHARGVLLLFTDADCAPAPDWIEAMTAPFADLEVVGVKGIYRTHQRGLIARFVQLEYEDKYDKMRGDRTIDFVDTYSAAYRRDVFAAAAGFDTVFPLPSVEDVELSFRLASQGYKLVFVPGAVVYHRHVDSIGGYWRRKHRFACWRILVYRRYPSKIARDSYTPHLMKAQIGIALLLLATGAGSLFSRELLVLEAALAGLFLISTIPFSVKALKRDRAVGLLAPAFLALRALASGTGLVRGAWNLLWRRGATAARPDYEVAPR